MHAITPLLRVLSAVLLGAALAMSAAADHPGARLDEAMLEKEKYFQAIDRPAPAFALRDLAGGRVSLDDLSGKVVVLQFVYASCPDICPLHTDRLAEVQAMLNDSPMEDMVEFVSITTDPANDTPAVLADYAEAHGVDRGNWRFLTIAPNQDEDATRALAEAFGHTFVKGKDGYQTHSTVTHILDRNGRWAANFHGLRF